VREQKKERRLRGGMVSTGSLLSHHRYFLVLERLSEGMDIE
jgi:hypothetical protein